MQTRPSLRRTTRELFAAAVLLPIVLGLFSFWAMKRYQDELKWVSHAKDVLSAIDELRVSVTEAESSQRGFLLTRDVSYLTAYDSKCRELSDKLKLLDQLTSNNIVQHINALRLEKAVWARVRKLDFLLSRGGRKGSGPDADPFKPSALASGSQMMREIRAICADMNLEENSRLVKRMSALQRAQIQVAGSFAAGLLASVVLLFWSYKRIQEYSRARDEAHRSLEELNSELESRVQERTSALRTALERFRQSNEDLTRFAYIASHDLREPLRVIGSFAGLLGKRYQGRLDPQADEYLRHMVDGAKRMHSLVQDLLTYSRVGTQGLNLEHVSINSIVEEIKRHLIGSTGNDGALIRCEEPLPIVWGDRIKLRQAFENLITNALKFCKAGVNVEVCIAAQRRGNEWVFSVRDNGIGFEPEYAQNIFVMFKRLHGIGRYEGTGIGLAICKRVIEAHEGRVWAESQPGVGSTFYFTLPIKSREQRLAATINEFALPPEALQESMNEISASYTPGGR
jgi:signal transduction histidine kinase